MAEETVGGAARYWSFISYSHGDAAFGRRLHRRLEAYLMPRRLVGRAAPRSTVPRRLAPIFRDREELSAAADLSAEVRAALQDSRSLIVVCSRKSAASAWVSREVELFRTLHPDRPILAAICDGDPPDCFPPSLLGSGAGGKIIEPLAADFRKHGDSGQHALLKLIAGILGIGLDELIQRDAQRRTQRVTAVTAASLALAVLMSIAAGVTFNAKKDADRQRSKAEGLVSFMDTDLRENLRGVGRLDLMKAVNHRALEYYDSQGDNLSPDSRANRALVLLALGEDDETRGARQSAVDKFKEAYSTTSALLSAEPNNPERVFDHAQSVYWLGYDKYAGGDVAGAKKAFAEYRQLAERMISLAPREPRYLREQALAEGDLCSLDFLSPMNPKSALDWCTHALEHMNTAVHRMPPSSVNQVHLFNRYHWMADAYHINGDDVHARERRLTAEKIITQLMTADPVNMDYKIQWIALQRNLARGEVRAGDMDQAKTRLTHASAVMDLLVIIDPNNQEWSQQKHKLDAELTKIIASKEGN